MSAFGVWCTVSGGVTGSRESWMKENGEIKTFPSETDAETEAAKWKAERKGSGFVSFGYYAREMGTS